MKLIKNLFFAVFLLISTISLSQTLTQDAEGHSSLIHSGTAVGLDILNANLSFTHNRFPTVRDSLNKPALAIGFNAYGKSVTGIRDVFSGNNFQPEAGVNVFFGSVIRDGSLEDQNAFKMLYFRFGMNTTSFRIVPVRPEPGEVYRNENFTGYNLGIGINSGSEKMLWGLELLYEGSNNLFLLPRENYLISTEQDLGNTTIQNQKEIAVYNGKFSDLQLINMNFDFAWLTRPEVLRNKVIVWNLYFRNKIPVDYLENYSLNAGFGVFLLQNEKNFSIGFFVEQQDIFHGFSLPEGSFSTKTGLVLRYNLINPGRPVFGL